MDAQFGQVGHRLPIHLDQGGVARDARAAVEVELEIEGELEHPDPEPVDPPRHLADADLPAIEGHLDGAGVGQPGHEGSRLLAGEVELEPHVEGVKDPHLDPHSHPHLRIEGRFRGGNFVDRPVPAGGVRGNSVTHVPPPTFPPIILSDTDFVDWTSPDGTLAQACPVVSMAI